MSTDLSGNIQSNVSTQVTCGPGQNSLWGYKYFGNQSGNSPMQFSDFSGAQVPHFQIRVIFWMIQIDSWTSSNAIYVTLNSTSLNQTVTKSQSSSPNLVTN